MLRKWLLYIVGFNLVCMAAVVGEDKLIPKERTLEIKPIVTVPTLPAPPKKKKEWVESPWEPPAQYVYADSSYVLEVNETTNTNLTCRKLYKALGVDVPPNNFRINACTIRSPDYTGRTIKCQIYLPTRTSVPAKLHGILYRHELAHCNGWVHD